MCEFMRNLKFTYFHIKNLLRKLSNITWWLVYPGVETSFDCSGLEGVGLALVGFPNCLSCTKNLKQDKFPLQAS